MKTIIIVKVLAPYAVPRFRALRSLSPFEVEVLALGRTETIRNWKLHLDELSLPYSEIFPEDNVDEKTPGDLSRAVAARLQELKPDVVIISGYGLTPMRAAARWAKTNGRVSILIFATTWNDRPRRLLKEWLKGWWIQKHFDAAFLGGERSAAYLEALGFPRCRMWGGCDVVDNEAFANAAATVRAQSDSLRTKLGLPEQYFLYVGRFAPEKNLARLLDAYAKYRNKTGNQAWGLVLVGSGPQEAELKAIAAGLEQVVWPGFQQVDALPIYYGLASCLILPSLSEPWGLVVNEALASGLPVLVSEPCGCVPELVRQGLNGYVFDPRDVDELTRLMELIASERVDLRAMGEESQRIIELYSPETWARSLADCIEQTAVRKGLASQ